MEKEEFEEWKRRAEAGMRVRTIRSWSAPGMRCQAGVVGELLDIQWDGAGYTVKIEPAAGVAISVPVVYIELLPPLEQLAGEARSKS